MDDRRVAHTEVRHPFERLKHHLRRAIPVRRLKSITNIALSGEGQALGRDRRARDIAAQPL